MITTGTNIFVELMNVGSSMSMARRMVYTGMVTLNGTEITNLVTDIEVNEGDVLQIGKPGKIRLWTFNGKKWIKEST